MSVGKNIKMLREQMRLTQLDLAKAAVCSVQAVSAWEQDRKTPRMGTISLLADYFRVPKSALIDGDGETITRLCLSNDEQKLLDAYRCISPPNRSLVLAMMEAALKSQDPGSIAG